jgi:hypothetical protein
VFVTIWLILSICGVTFTLILKFVVGGKTTYVGRRQNNILRVGKSVVSRDVHVWGQLHGVDPGSHSDWGAPASIYLISFPSILGHKLLCELVQILRNSTCPLCIGLIVFLVQTKPWWPRAFVHSAYSRASFLFLLYLPSHLPRLLMFGLHINGGRKKCIC